MSVNLNMNKRGDWTLAAILGLFGVGIIVVSLSGGISKLWIILGIILLVLGFIANKK